MAALYPVIFQIVCTYVVYGGTIPRYILDRVDARLYCMAALYPVIFQIVCTPVCSVWRQQHRQVHRPSLAWCGGAGGYPWQTHRPPQQRRVRPWHGTLLHFSSAFSCISGSHPDGTASSEASLFIQILELDSI